MIYDEEALNQRVSRQSIIESAIIERYSEESEAQRAAEVAHRLNRIDYRLRSLEWQNEAIAESVGTFLRMWLYSTPE